MKLVGMMACRNEQWVIGLSLRVALLWCDAVVVLLHACTDSSAAIVDEVEAENKGRISIITHRHECWTEMAHRQQMLERARNWGATHLAIIDADEVLTGNLLNGFEPNTPSMIRCVVASAHEQCLELPGYNLRDSYSPGQYGEKLRPRSVGLHYYHSNGVWGNRWFSTAFKDAPDLGWSGDRFHHREPGPRKLQSYRPIQQGQGGVMHLWSCSAKRLHQKHRLYRLTERLRWPEKPVADIERMYSWAEKGDPENSAYGTPETWTYSTVPESWWKPYQHLMQYLHLENEPWQRAECDRIIAQYGRDYFKGLSID